MLIDATFGCQLFTKQNVYLLVYLSNFSFTIAPIMISKSDKSERMAGRPSHLALHKQSLS